MMARFAFQFAGLFALAPWALCGKVGVTTSTGRDKERSQSEGYFAEIDAHNILIGSEKPAALMRRDATTNEKAANKADDVNGTDPTPNPTPDPSDDPNPNPSDSMDGALGSISGILEISAANHSEEFLTNGAAQEAVQCAIATVAGVTCKEVSCGFHSDTIHDAEELTEQREEPEDDSSSSRSATVNDIIQGELDKFTVGFTVNAPLLQVPTTMEKIANMAPEGFLQDIATEMDKHDLKPHTMTLDGIWVVEGTSLPDIAVVNNSLSHE